MGDFSQGHLMCRQKKRWRDEWAKCGRQNGSSEKIGTRYKWDQERSLGGLTFTKFHSIGRRSPEACFRKV